MTGWVILRVHKGDLSEDDLLLHDSGTDDGAVVYLDEGEAHNAARLVSPALWVEVHRVEVGTRTHPLAELYPPG